MKYFSELLDFCLTSLGCPLLGYGLRPGLGFTILLRLGGSLRWTSIDGWFSTQAIPLPITDTVAGKQQ